MSQRELPGYGQPDHVRFRVFGSPAPKGSPNVVTRDRHGQPLKAPRVLGDSPALARWDRAVKGCALAAVHGRGRPVYVGRPLACEIHFVLPRPAAASRRYHAHYAQGDLDKLVRATLDPLEGLVFDNDRRIVELSATKAYAGSPGSVLDLPLGAVVDVWPLDVD